MYRRPPLTIAESLVEIAQSIVNADHRYGNDNFTTKTLQQIRNEMLCEDKPMSSFYDFSDRHNKIEIHYHRRNGRDGAFVIHLYNDKIELERIWCGGDYYIMEFPEIKHKWLKYYEESHVDYPLLMEGYVESPQ
jgi:hypothetical protein